MFFKLLDTKYYYKKQQDDKIILYYKDVSLLSILVCNNDTISLIPFGIVNTFTYNISNTDFKCDLCSFEVYVESTNNKTYSLVVKILEINVSITINNFFNLEEALYWIDKPFMINLPSVKYQISLATVFRNLTFTYLRDYSDKLPLKEKNTILDKLLDSEDAPWQWDLQILKIVSLGIFDFLEKENLRHLAPYIVKCLSFRLSDKSIFLLLKGADINILSN